MKQDQPFDYLVVLDFEATCDTQKQPVPREVIEFPSVLLSMQTLEPVSEFSAFVKPHYHSKLTRFCTELTGIRQEQIDRAAAFPEVMKRHLDWLRAHGLPVETDGEGPSYALASCGDWDLGTMFPNQLRQCVPPLENIPLPYRRWVNIKRAFARWKGVSKAPGMTGMLRALGLDLVGHHHRGIDDCRNIASIVKALVERGEIINITTGISNAKHPPVTLTISKDRRSCRLTLERRSLKGLLVMASGCFKCQIRRAFHRDGRELLLDDHVFDLTSHTEVTVTDGRPFRE